MRPSALIKNTALLAIVGPTAVGKTALAIETAKKLNGEVIGLDSRQMYVGMEIGTAQPTAREQSQVPHHLVGLRLPHQRVSAGEYASLVEGVIVDILQRRRLPIICGGAGLYYRALTKGIFSGSKSNLSVRYKLEKIYEEEGPLILMKRLEKVDPEYAKIVHPNNKKRLVRALEIYESTGITPTEQFNNQNSNPVVTNVFSVLITMDMKKLTRRIEERTKAMIASGWVGETERLKSYDYGDIYPSDSIGYEQIKRHLSGELSFENMVKEINIKTRQYAKRQFTWFNKEAINLKIDMTDRDDWKKPALQITKAFKQFKIQKSKGKM
ncbi:MAG: tRNA (adenosine(37)-N6)-dimethylallyltransferase MiaA [Candidatus Neomarinimicrobiota bacterium]